MTANLTEGSSPANQTMPMLDASPVACTEIVTFTEVLAVEEWGSFYSSFKVSVLALKARTGGTEEGCGCQSCYWE